MLMPGKGGWDTLYALKKTPITAAIPVIVVTVVDEPKIGLALGAAEYLVKPVDKEVLLEDRSPVYRSGIQRSGQGAGGGRRSRHARIAQGDAGIGWLYSGAGGQRQRGAGGVGRISR